MATEKSFNAERRRTDLRKDIYALVCYVQYFSGKTECCSQCCCYKSYMFKCNHPKPVKDHFMSSYHRDQFFGKMLALFKETEA